MNKKYLKIKKVFRYMLSVTRSGFTLMEVVIAMGIFTIASLVVSSVYLNANNLHQHTVSAQRLQNEGRYIMEKLTREIRGREIDYGAGALDPTQPQERLKFKADESGAVAEINYLSESEEIRFVWGGAVARLNADDVKVTNLKFYIFPDSGDLFGNPAGDKQPRVTILLTLQNITPNPKFQREISLQTTVSSKVYKR